MIDRNLTLEDIELVLKYNKANELVIQILKDIKRVPVDMSQLSIQEDSYDPSELRKVLNRSDIFIDDPNYALPFTIYDNEGIKICIVRPDAVIGTDVNTESITFKVPIDAEDGEVREEQKVKFLNFCKMLCESILRYPSQD